MRDRSGVYDGVVRIPHGPKVASTKERHQATRIRLTDLFDVDSEALLDRALGKKLHPAGVGTGNFQCATLSKIARNTGFRCQLLHKGRVHSASGHRILRPTRNGMRLSARSKHPGARRTRFAGYLSRVKHRRRESGLR